MTRKICVLLLVMVLSFVLCVPAYAASGTITASGFYDIGEAANVAITPMVGEKDAILVDADIDKDEYLDEKLYMNSDRLKVEYSAATQDAFYGVVLVTGTGLPTKDNTIYYIDQLTAVNNKVTFDVYPTLPTESGVMTLYITSNAAGASLVSVPLYYTTKGSFAADGLIYTLGDVNNDGDITSQDALWTLKISVDLHDASEIEFLAADVNEDGDATSQDALSILKYSVGIIDSWN